MRSGNDRFRRTTIADFGLKVFICAACRRFVTLDLGETRPDFCPHCKKPLKDISEK